LVQQVAQRGARLAETPPHQVAAVPGARQRDVEQAQALGELLVAPQLFVRPELGRTEVELHAVAVLPIVERDVGWIVGARAAPRERTEHDRILEALAAM